jgi:RNA polymerase sigma-70 factor (sigma-E family)
MEGEEVCMPRSSRDEEFSAFVSERRSGLVRSASLLTAGDTHLAEDLVQTALARLYVAWPKVRQAGTESAYVWRIIVNAHIDEVRRPRHRRERHVSELPDRPAPQETFPDGLGGAEVRRALAALPPGMRAAVVLRHWLDLSVGETADLMNCSEGTVKSQTAKAAARLRELLSPAVAERTYP